MDPTLLFSLLSSATPIVSKLLGYAFGAGDREKADKLMNDAQREYAGITMPTIEETSAQLGPSAMAGITTDPRLQGAQMQALDQLQRLGMEGPDNLTFRAGMDAATRTTSREANARDAAIQQDLATKGMGKSGIGYALRERSAQDANDRLAAGGFQSAFAGRQAALGALESGAGLAGNIRAQDFGEQERKARAADEINQWNAGHRADAYQQAFRNSMGLAGAKSGFATQRANQLYGLADETGKSWGNIGAGVGQGIDAVAQRWLRPRVTP